MSKLVSLRDALVVEPGAASGVTGSQRWMGDMWIFFGGLGIPFKYLLLGFNGLKLALDGETENFLLCFGSGFLHFQHPSLKKQG